MKFAHVASTLLVATCLTRPVAAQTQLASADANSPSGDASENRATSLEDIIVTARKRSENLQRVPVAVQSLSGEQLLRGGILQATDLGRQIPGVAVTPQSGRTSTTVFVVRGQSAVDTTLQFGPPVGLYEDGVNIPHPVGANAAFFDLSNLQVLKGPQGTLYGRNTTAGAVLLETRGADFKGIHGFVGGEVGNHEDWKINGAINFTLVPDLLAVRVAGQHWNRDGFGRSIITGERQGGTRDDSIGRARILFTPGNFTFDTTLEYGELHHKNDLVNAQALGLGTSANGLTKVKTTFCNPAIAGGCPAGSVLVPILNVALQPTSVVSSGFAPQAAINSQFGPGVYSLADCVGRDLDTSCTSFPTEDSVRTFHFAERISVDLGSFATLKSITGYHWFKNYSLADYSGIPGNTIGSGVPIVGAGVPGGSSPLPKSVTGPDGTSGQWTQELNLSGKLDRLTWLLGGFASWDKGASKTWGGVTPALGTTAFSVGYVPKYKSTTWAIFSQEDFKFNDWFSVTGGLRYTHETERQAAAAAIYAPGGSAFGSGSPYVCSQGPNTYFLLGGTSHSGFSSIDGCLLPENSVINGVSTDTLSTKSSALSYLLSLNLQVTPDMLVYVKTAKGTRGGVVQNRLFTAPPAKPENDVDYEIGYKAEFLDHRVRLNAAAFTSKLSNKQQGISSVINGVLVAYTFNATSARITGFEADVQARPIAGLTLSATVGYLKTKFGQFFAPSKVGGGTLEDATGTPFYNTPPWQYSLGANYEVPVGPGTLAVEGDWAWRSRTPIPAYRYDPLVPLAVQRGYAQPIGLLNGNIEYRLPDAGVAISAFVTNLLDKRHVELGSSAPVNGVAAGAVSEPRMFGLRIRKTFGQE